MSEKNIMDKEKLLSGPLCASRDGKRSSLSLSSSSKNSSNDDPAKKTNEDQKKRHRSPSPAAADHRSRHKKQHFHYYENTKKNNITRDPHLPVVDDDPRGSDPTKKLTTKASSRGHGRNTESFDPASTLVRPDLRIQIGSSKSSTYNRPLKHDDVVIIPELFGPEDDWELYYKLVQEIRDLQQPADTKEEEEEKKEQENDSRKNTNNHNKKTNGKEWIAWHEGAHLICKDPSGSPTFEMVKHKLCEYFQIDPAKPIGTRFNWYRDSSDWKPFHHDSAAFNPQRAKNQNITVGVSFGAMRELAFIHASQQNIHNPNDKCKLYFPQTNNGVFSFGRDANIRWKHGINAVPPNEQDGKGRISIILWGWAKNVIEEDHSPPLLGSDGQGPHANKRRPHQNHRPSSNRRHRDNHDRWEPPQQRHNHPPPTHRSDHRHHHDNDRQRNTNNGPPRHHHRRH